MNYDKDIKYYRDNIDKLESNYDELLKSGELIRYINRSHNLGGEYFHLFENTLVLNNAVTPEMKEYLKRSSECYLEGFKRKLKYHNDEILTKEYLYEVPSDERVYLGGTGTVSIGICGGIEFAIMGDNKKVFNTFFELIQIDEHLEGKKYSNSGNYYYLTYLYKHFLYTKNEREIRRFIEESRENKKLKKEFSMIINCFEDILFQENQKFQINIDKLIRKKEGTEKRNHDLFVIWPTLWSICIIAQRRGLKFEVDNRFLPKYCLESYE